MGCGEGSLFIADASGVIMVTAHVRFTTVNCFCKEMGVFGQVGGETGVCKQGWLYRKPFSVINLSDGSNAPSSFYIQSGLLSPCVLDKP